MIKLIVFFSFLFFILFLNSFYIHCQTLKEKKGLFFVCVLNLSPLFHPSSYLSSFCCGEMTHLSHQTIPFHWFVCLTFTKFRFSLQSKSACVSFCLDYLFFCRNSYYFVQSISIEINICSKNIQKKIDYTCHCMFLFKNLLRFLLFLKIDAECEAKKWICCWFCLL